jgi:ubiquinone/menaquinone biosynthesis C-methylase UbiE
MIAETLVRARTLAYRLASPAERVWRSASGKNPLAPLWLRRHTGPVAQFESAARDTAAFLDRLGLVHADDCILDIGCGAGAMVPEFARRLGPKGRYVGFDVHAPSIRWCRDHYAKDPRLAFELAEIASAYGTTSGPSATSFRFPIEDGEANLVLAKSVFTHLLAPEASHYLAETCRALKSGSAAVITAFLFDASAPVLPLVHRAFPFGDRNGLVRWRLQARPTAAVAYEKSSFERMVQAAGLRVQWMSPGYFPGGRRLAGQDTLLLGR